MFKQKVLKALSEPREAVRVVRATLLGFVVRFWYGLGNSRIVIGKKFRAYSWIYIKGPGKVTIGDNVSVEISFLRLPSILTHHRNSEVIIENGTYIGGTRISCVDRIVIGEESLLASVTIVDSDMIPNSIFRIDSEWKKKFTAPIQVGHHFWGGTNSFVLKGSEIGAECVLGAGSVVFDKIYPARSLLMGNPARRIGDTRSE